MGLPEFEYAAKGLAARYAKKGETQASDRGKLYLKEKMNDGGILCPSTNYNFSSSPLFDIRACKRITA